LYVCVVLRCIVCCFGVMIYLTTTAFSTHSATHAACHPCCYGLLPARLRNFLEMRLDVHEECRRTFGSFVAAAIKSCVRLSCSPNHVVYTILRSSTRCSSINSVPTINSAGVMFSSATPSPRNVAVTEQSTKYRRRAIATYRLNDSPVTSISCCNHGRIKYL